MEFDTATLAIMTYRHNHMKGFLTMLTKNQLAPAIRTTSLGGQPIELSTLRGKTVLIKFHRFSGCPVARCQIDDLIKRQDELSASGIETIVFLHSSVAKILPNFHEVPGLHIVADRQKAFYREYQSRFLWRKLFSAASWRATFSAFTMGYFPQFNRFEGGVVGLPSDFLVDKTGRIIDVHYGKHFGDSWTVSDVLSKVDSRLDRAATSS
jgi:peroxiredoxin